MASSGVVTYTVNELDIVTDALHGIGVYGVGQTINADDIVLCRRKLNMLMKQWSGAIDFAPGFKMWTRKRATVFLQKDQSSYSLGPSGDHATASYVRTTLSVNAASLAASISLTSTIGISNADYIGIVLNSGAIHWTTVSSIGSPTTISSGLASAASSGNTVFSYTTKMRRPLRILTSMLKSADNKEQYIDPGMLLEEYESITDKTVDGTPDRFYFEAQLTNANIYLNRQPDDVGKVISLVYLSPIEDFTGTNDTADFAQEWYRPLSLQLQIDISPSYGKPVTQELKLLRDESLSIARNAYPQEDRSYFEPNADGDA
jgi:hypothetical protein